MQDDVSDITHFYDESVLQEEERLLRHQLEFDLTWRYLEEFLPADGPILEIGAATGRYTIPLAQRGHSVTAVDFSPALLARCRENVAGAGLSGRVTFQVADARDLSAVPSGPYAAVLLMGPLYHLVEAADRRLALQNAIDRLASGAPLFTAFISRYGIMGDLIKNVPAWIEEQEKVRAHLATGRRPEGVPAGGFRGYFVRAEEVVPLHEEMGLETVAFAAVEPGISADDESYNLLEGDQRRLWLDLLYQISTEPSLIGASRHLLYIGRKPA